MKKVLKKVEHKPEIKDEKVLKNRGKIVDGDVDEELSLESRPMSITKGERRIGCSKGATVPTVAYGNIKISVWEERVVKDNDSTAHKALEEISEYLDNWLQTEIDEALKSIK